MNFPHMLLNFTDSDNAKRETRREILFELKVKSSAIKSLILTIFNKSIIKRLMSVDFDLFSQILFIACRLIMSDTLNNSAKKSKRKITFKR